MRVLVLFLFCNLLFAETKEEIIDQYQEKIDNLLFDLNYQEAIELIEEFESLYPDERHFDDLLVSLEEMQRAQNQERVVVQREEREEEEELVVAPLLLRRPIFYKLSEPFYELSSQVSLRSSNTGSEHSWLDYFSFLEMSLFPFGEGDNFGFALSYRGRQLPVHQQQPLLAANTIEASLLLRFLLFESQERGALSLRTFFSFGLFFTPLSSSPIDNNLIFTIGTSLRGTPLYVIFDIQPFEKIYSTLELKFSFFSESNSYSDLSILFALMYRFGQILIGPHYLFQLQNWGMSQLNSHNLGLRLEFYLDRGVGIH